MSLEFQHLVDPLHPLVHELTTDRLDLDSIVPTFIFHIFPVNFDKDNLLMDFSCTTISPAPVDVEGPLKAVFQATWFSK